jgi:hypothetical protein
MTYTQTSLATLRSKAGSLLQKLYSEFGLVKTELDALGETVDTLSATVQNSNLSADHKITRSATIVVAASDSSAKSKAQADYVCDGANDQTQIDTALSALPAIGGTIQFLEGSYTVQGLPINSNISYKGLGYVTKLKLPAGATQSMFVAAAAHIHGGQISDLELDGTNASTQNGIDFTDALSIGEYYIQRNYIHNFNHGYHGSQDDRFCPIVDNKIWTNTVGIYIVNNHPNIGVNDIRQCEIGLGGHIHDVQCTGTKFNYNITGVGGVGTTIGQSQFNGCHFGHNVTGIELTGSGNILNGCLIVGGATSQIGVKINGTKNSILNSEFRSDATPAQFSTSAIFFGDNYNGSFAKISGNTFEIANGTIISAGTGNGIRESISITNNVFQIGGQAINFPNTDTTYPLLYALISGNNIQFVGDIGTAPIINLPNTIAGGIVSMNMIYVISGSVVGPAISVDARSAVISLNKIRRSTGIVTTQTDSNTINVNNIYIA